MFLSDSTSATMLHEKTLIHYLVIPFRTCVSQDLSRIYANEQLISARITTCVMFKNKYNARWRSDVENTPRLRVPIRLLLFPKSPLILFLSPRNSKSILVIGIHYPPTVLTDAPYTWCPNLIWLMHIQWLFCIRVYTRERCAHNPPWDEKGKLVKFCDFLVSA